MKDAMAYARQALRFAERVCDDVDALRAEADEHRRCGAVYARRQNATAVARCAFVYDAMHNAANAARGARRARKGGGWAESWRAHACESAKRAAWCAGYAARDGDLTNVI